MCVIDVSHDFLDFVAFLLLLLSLFQFFSHLLWRSLGLLCAYLALPHVLGDLRLGWVPHARGVCRLVRHIPDLGFGVIGLILEHLDVVVLLWGFQGLGPRSFIIESIWLSRYPTLLDLIVLHFFGLVLSLL